MFLLSRGGGRPGFEKGDLLVCTNGDGSVEFYWPGTTAPSALYRADFSCGETRESRYTSQPSFTVSGLPAGEKLEIRVWAVADGKSFFGQPKEVKSWKSFHARLTLPESLEEKQLLCSTEVYRQIQQQWEGLDTALVNIGDYPSSPDFASLVRYGSLLQRERACGRMLIYYFNEDGFVIQSEQDFAIQIPIDLLKRCPNIIGVCSANTSVKALRGALKSGFFTHLVARAELIKALLE